MKLSLLICHLLERHDKLKRLHDIIEPQITSGDVECLVDAAQNDTIGTKRNRLLQRSTGEYVAFVDDDDGLSNNYIKLLMEGIALGVDCCSLKGAYYNDGYFEGLFEHSIKYNAYKTNDDSVWGQTIENGVVTNVFHVAGPKIRFERFPNHLNCIKASIAKQFTFPEKNHGEDTDFATQIFKSGLLKTEHYIPQVIYTYDCRSK